MDFSTLDQTMMTRALALAERGLWTTKPNPRVGCVIAHGEEIVGEGWHERAGGPHAEVFALRAAGARARGATVYVTLEPCAHHGRTPPCADALVGAGVARVIAATGDSNRAVAGQGYTRLRAAGIAVETGLLEDEARALNAGFFSRIERGRPWVRVKVAMSIDGRTALEDGQSKWITGRSARADVQRWRARSSAILTGIGTVLADNPRLTARPRTVEAWKRRAKEGRVRGLRSEDVGTEEQRAPIGIDLVPPLRVILDSKLRTPARAKVLDGEAPTLVVHERGIEPVDFRFERVERVAVARDGRGLDIEAVLAELALREVNEVQVEAGSKLVGSLIVKGLVDEMLVYMAPVIFGDTARPMATMPGAPSIGEGMIMTVVEQKAFNPDVRLRFLPGLHGRAAEEYGDETIEDEDVHGNH